MNGANKRDIYYTFSFVCPKQIYSSIIDESWRKDKLKGLFDIDVEVVLPNVNNSKLNMQHIDIHG